MDEAHVAILELYLEQSPLVFAGSKASLGSAEYALYGVPFDSTSSYRPGSRFAPQSIREASLNIESNSLTGSTVFVEDVPIADLGDLAVVHGNSMATIERVERVSEALARHRKVQLVVGGEHTITAGVVRGLVRAGFRPCLMVVDAHLDLRDEYLGCRLGHASAIRRSLEALGDVRVVYLGARAYAREELEYLEVNSDRIRVFGPQELKRLGPRNVASMIKTFTSECDSMYLSLDIDGIDPAYAPGTGTPEPMGLEVYDIFRIIADVVDQRFIAMDLVEVNPIVDHSNVTSILAARLIQEFVLVREGKKA